MGKLLEKRKHLSQGEIAYEVISNLILDGKLKPGQPMNEVELCELTDTSRTPVREAIGKLAQEKIVKIIPRKGAFVTKLDMEDIREIFQLREAIEGMAARLACSNLDIERLETLERKCESLLNESNPERQHTHIEVNDELHNYILEQCGNERFKSIVKQFTTVLHLEMNITVQLKNIIENSCAEHIRIIQAFKERDADKAESVMRSHISEVYDRLIEALKNGFYV